MNWTRRADLKSQLQRLWDKGDVLASMVSGETCFPRRLQFKSPNAKEMVDCFDDVRRWVSEINSIPNCRIVSLERKNQVLGRNSLPHEVWIDNIDDFASWLGKKREIDSFSRIVESTRQEHPELLSWLTKKPLLALTHAGHWRAILTVISWVAQHPRPGIYIRQIDIASVHTKFIEENRSLLGELLDLVLPATAINDEFVGTSQFAARYGFKDKPLRVRFRLLDSSQSLLPSVGDQDITLDAHTFSKLDVNVQRVFITENEINFLAFPQMANSMVIFGAGYGFESLSAATWLLHCDMYYWGDIDSHGLAILHSLRTSFPHVRSILMDEQTLLRFQDLRTPEPEQHQAETLDALTVEEAAVYRGLKHGTWGDNFRLEQERIDWGYACDTIRDAVTTSEAAAREESLAIVTCSDLTDHLRPSKCDLRLWLRKHAEPTDGAPYDDFIRIQYDQLIARQMDCLADCLDLSRFDERTRATATADAIANRAPVIFKPLLNATCKLAGTNVRISGEGDFLILENGRYCVRNVTLARRSDAGTHSEVQLKLQLFAWLMRRGVHESPARLELFNGRAELQPVQDDLGRASLRTLCTIIATQNLPRPPYEPVGWTKCDGCTFRTHCFTKAESCNDVALLLNVDQATAHALHRAGAGTIQSLIDIFDESSLERLQINANGKTSRVGKKASTILATAKAAASKESLWLQPPTLPSVHNYVVFDFEGLPPHLETEALVFLWGLQIFGQDEEPYRFALAENADQDQQAWSVFLKHAQSIFAKHGNIPFYHWNHYETTMLRSYIAKYGDNDGIAHRITANAIDLLQMVRSSVALPIYSYGLKVVERYVGFERKLSTPGGSWAISQYLASLAATSDTARQDLLNQIQLYNQEDLEAVNAVLNWFHLQSKTRPQVTTLQL